MEYLAKIIHEQKYKKFWKYGFIDLQTGWKNWFCNNYRINYIPGLSGKLNLLEGNKHPKSFQSFEQDIKNVDKLNK